MVLVLICLSGCSTPNKKQQNKSLFEQALVIQQFKGTAGKQQSSADEVLTWKFNVGQYQLSDEQRKELLTYCLAIARGQSPLVKISLGPDWLSSYKRGNQIRLLIPRGFKIEQQYNPKMDENSVTVEIGRSIAL